MPGLGLDAGGHGDTASKEGQAPCLPALALQRRKGRGWRLSREGAGREQCLQSQRAETEACSSPAQAAVPEAQQGTRKWGTLCGGYSLGLGDGNLHTQPLDKHKIVTAWEVEGLG